MIYIYLSHNLREYFSSSASSPSPDNYGSRFLSTIHDLITSTPNASPADSDLDLSTDRVTMSARIEKMTSHPDYKRSHPTPEHLSPLFVALGAAADSNVTAPAGRTNSAWEGEGEVQAKPVGVVEMELNEGPLGWGFYRFD